MTTTLDAPPGWASLAGQVVPAHVRRLFDLHAAAVTFRVAVTADEWVNDLATIAEALGFPPGLDSRNRVAALIANASGVTR